MTKSCKKNIDNLEAYDDSSFAVHVLIIDTETSERKAADTSFELTKISTEETVAQGQVTRPCKKRLTTLEIPDDVDLSSYATTAAMQAGDAATLASANTFTTDSIADIEIPEYDLPENIATTEDITAAVEGLASEQFVETATEGLATEQFVIDAILEIPGVDVSGFATIAYVDAADQDLQNQIDLLSVQKGAAARYRLESIQTPDFTPRRGEMGVDWPIASQAKLLQIATADQDGNPTKSIQVGDIIELVGTGPNAIDTRFRCTDNTLAPVRIGVDFINNDQMFEVNEIYTVYIYPQNEQGASKKLRRRARRQHFTERHSMPTRER